MTNWQSNDQLTRLALAVGVAVPLLYFGTQLAAAPFYPHYNFFTQAASQLGSDQSRWPVVFNVGAVVTGLATVVAAGGYWLALRSLGGNGWLAGLMALALVSCGLASVNAGLFPLPDPRHALGLLGAGMFALPVLLAVVGWSQQRGARRLSLYWALNTAAFVLVVVVNSGALGRLGAAGEATQQWLNAKGGLVQRLTALVVFGPIGVGAFALARRLRPAAGAPEPHGEGVPA